MRTESLVLGLALASGVLLSVSPRLWPLRSKRRRIDPWGWLRDDLRYAGIRASVPRTVVVIALLAIALAALTLATTGLSALAAVALLAGLAGPVMLIRARASARRAKLRALWPDVLDSLIAALRAGLGLPDALGSLAQHGPGPLQAVFRDFVEDYRRSASFELSLTRLKARLADPVADRIVEILRLARELGGSDVIALLGALGGYLREDAAAMAELTARQSWIRNAARLGVAAPWLVLVALSLRPDVRGSYNSPAGAMVILAGGALTLLAYQLMRRVARLPQERRWA